MERGTDEETCCDLENRCFRYEETKVSFELVLNLVLKLSLTNSKLEQMA